MKVGDTRRDRDASTPRRHEPRSARIAQKVVTPMKLVTTTGARSAVWRVRIALGLKGVAYEYVAVQHRARRRRAARRRLPRAQPDGAGADARVLDDGAARARAVAGDPRVSRGARARRRRSCRRDPYLRARARAARRDRQLRHPAAAEPVDDRSGVKSSAATPSAWARHFIARGLAALEARRRRRAGAFLVGDAPSIADVCLVPQLNAARRFGSTSRRWPLLARDRRRAASRCPRSQTAHADRQPDARREESK